MAVDDVWLVTVNATQYGNLRQNTLAFIATTENDPTLGAFSPLAVAMKDLYRPQQNSSVNYTSWKARQIAGTGVTWPETGSDCSPSGGLYFEQNFSAPTSGGAVGDGDGLPPQCALVTTLRTGLIGRSHRGRHFAYGFGETHQIGGTWQASLITPTNTAWTAFFTSFAVPAPASGYRLGIWSTVIASGCRRLPDGSHVRFDQSHPELAFSAAESFINRSTVYTQRRRVTGHGL
jgi:hypothetical protein